MATMTLLCDITIRKADFDDLKADHVIVEAGGIECFFADFDIEHTVDDVGDVDITGIDPDAAVDDDIDALSPLMRHATTGSHALFFCTQDGATLLYVRAGNGSVCGMRNDLASTYLRKAIVAKSLTYATDKD